MNHAQDHLWHAVAVLATEQGRIKERLQYAVQPLLEAEMNFSEIPTSLQSEYKALCGALTAVDDPKEGSIAATVQGLSDEEAIGFADRIVRLFRDSLQMPG